MNDYCDALIEQIGFFGKDEKRAVDTVYLGGGTPSLLGPDNLRRLCLAVRAAFNLCDPEITLEANPADNLLDTFLAASTSGVNRISLGVQSAVEQELKVLNRRHTNSDVIKAVDDARKAGIDNISLDLMLGIPHQTRQSLNTTLKFLTDLEPKHISAYILKVEDSTPLAKMGYTVADDSLCADLYLDASKTLTNAGFEHYEVSNFAKAGYKSRHNLRYWNLSEYIGIGPSAHSFYKGKRFYCEPDLKAFLNNPAYTPDGEGGKADEYIMLNLRTNKGIDFNALKLEYNIDITPALELFKKLEKNKLGVLSEHNFKLTAEGFLVSNSIIADVLLECNL